MEHWLGNIMLERHVFRVLRLAQQSLSCRELLLGLCRSLREEALLPEAAALPDEIDAYQILHRLMQKGRVEKFANVDGSIRFRPTLYRR